MTTSQTANKRQRISTKQYATYTDAQKIEHRRAKWRANKKRQHDIKKAKGVCVRCGKNPREENKTQCGSCLAFFKSYQSARRIRNRAAGICFVCGKNPVSEFATCDECSKKRRAIRSKHKYKKSGDRWKAIITGEGRQCARCRTYKTYEHFCKGAYKPMGFSTYCRVCRTIQKQDYRLRLRQALLKERMPPFFVNFAKAYIHKNFNPHKINTREITQADILQEAELVFMKLKEKYPQWEDKRLMGAFKTALWRRLIEIIRKHEKHIKAGAADNHNDKDGDYVDAYENIADNGLSTDELMQGLYKTLDADDKALLLECMQRGTRGWAAHDDKKARVKQLIADYVANLND